MEIKVIHEIRFAKETSNLLELVATAIVGALANTSTTTEQPAQKVETATALPSGAGDVNLKVEKDAAASKQEPKANVATKLCYFQHAPTGDLVEVKKGESLDFLDTDDFSLLSPVEYNRLKASQEAAEKAAQGTPADEPETINESGTEDESEAVTLKIEDLRVIASKFVSAGKQKELKALFGEFEDENGVAAVKISAIQKADYATFMDRAKAVLDELGVK